MICGTFIGKRRINHVRRNTLSKNNAIKTKVATVLQSIATREFQLPALPLRATDRVPAVHRLRRKIRLTAMLGGGLVCVLFVGGAVIPLGGAVVASGQVDVSSRVKRIAHPRGGVVSAILVHDGQHVYKGQILARLDDTVPGA